MTTVLQISLNFVPGCRPIYDYHDYLVIAYDCKIVINNVKESIIQQKLLCVFQFGILGRADVKKMPSNSDFKLEILVADTPVPEYTRNGEHFVECSLSTPVSYMHRQTDIVNGEAEVQVTMHELHTCGSCFILFCSSDRTRAQWSTLLSCLG